jgi:hypothetical protein
MNKEIIKVINKIANEIILLFNSILEDDSISTNAKVGKNTLKDSNLKKDFETKVEKGESIVIECLMNHYIDYIEAGRTEKYKKRPPISALRDWALKNNISTDNRTLYAISVAIWKDGYAARPILATLDELIEQQFETVWGLELFKAIIDELEKYFNP